MGGYDNDRLSQECQHRSHTDGVPVYLGTMREFEDAGGSRWRAEVISRGGTSEYLNPRVHRPILQFSCLDRRLPRRYVGYTPGDASSLETLPDSELRKLLNQASVH